jgi:hypothetical protein
MNRYVVRVLTQPAEGLATRIISPDQSCVAAPAGKLACEIVRFQVAWTA